MSADRFMQPLESRQLLASTGTHDLLYVRVRFADQTSLPESITQAQQVTSQATSVINEWSGGLLKFNITLKDVQLPNPTSYYKSKGTSAISSDATAILQKSGVNIGSFEHRSFRYNGSIGTFAGLGQVGGPITWIRSTSGSVLAHELGHNLGLGHSHFVNPSDNSKPFGSGASSEYGDPFSNMGSGGTRDWNANQKWSLGYLNSSQVKSVSSTTVKTSTFTVTAHDNIKAFAAADVYLVRIPVGTNAIYAELRKDAGGVVIHRAAASKPTSGDLIDGHAGTATANDAALKAGESLVDPRGSGAADDVRITVMSLSGNNAVIKVTVGASTAAASSASAAAAAPTSSSPAGSMAIILKTKTQSVFA